MKSAAATALDKITSNDASATIYRALLAKLKAIGRFEIEPKASSLHIVHRRAFLGVHYRKDGLLLNIVLDRALKGPRIKRAEQVSRSRFHNEILLSSPQELDSALLAWVGDAYRLTAESD